MVAPHIAMGIAKAGLDPAIKGSCYIHEAKTTSKTREWAAKQHPENSINHPLVKDNRHAFRPALRFEFDARVLPHVRAARAVLTQYDRGTFERYVNPLQVSGLNYQPQLVNGLEVHYLAIGRAGLMAKVPVGFQVSLDFHRATRVKEIMVVDGDSTYKLEDWLQTLPQPTRSTPVGEAGYDMLHQWHQDCRTHTLKPTKSFKNMPAEIKADILLHMVGAVRPVNVVGGSWNRSTGTVDYSTIEGDEETRGRVGSSLYLMSSLRPRVPDLDFNILTLSKEIHKLVVPIIRTQTIKSFDKERYLTNFVRQAPRPFQVNVTRLQLAFCDTEYMGFFNLELPGFGQIESESITRRSGNMQPYECVGNWNSCNATALSKLPALKYLEIWFNSPLDPKWCSPWFLNKDQCTNPDIDAYRFPCRKIMIDYILTAAFPFIHHIPQLNITGFVKTATRDLWLSIFHNRQDRGNQLVKVKQQLVEMKNLSPEQVPPPCHCPSPCFYPDLLQLEYERKSKLPEEAAERYKFDFDDDFTDEERAAIYISGRQDLHEMPKHSVIGETYGCRGVCCEHLINP